MPKPLLKAWVRFRKRNAKLPKVRFDRCMRIVDYQVAEGISEA
jgi:hypothetical protein